MIKACPLATDFEREIESAHQETIELLKTLCAIPAPSHHEERRAEFVKNWFEERGLSAEIDDAKNVRCGFALQEHRDMVVVMAHMDTVFPDMEPMPIREEGEKLYCPGVGDDTANLAGMMILVDRLHRMGYKPTCGVLFVGNSCEEGLGNLKGCKAIMRDFSARVKAFITLDGNTEEVCARAVGSTRYRITAKTRGGHSFADFGTRNAIEVLSRLTCALYRQNVPHIGGSVTTYNVGVISGGTSINAIAQHAEMLYEYRSNDPQCMAAMKDKLDTLLRENALPDAQVEVEVLGERPCGEAADKNAQSELENAALQALAQYAGTKPQVTAGSTDCNIPLSLGIPSVCFGMYRGEGAHTREEWIEPESMRQGMKAAAAMLLNWFEK